MRLKKPYIEATVVTMVLAAALLISWLAHRSKQGPSTPVTPGLASGTNHNEPAGLIKENARQETNSIGAIQPPADKPLSDRIARTAQALKASRSQEDSRRQLAVLRAHLASAEPAVVSTAIRQFLDSKLDAATQLEFTIGPNGFLSGSPTLRVFLLDCWAQTDLAAAAAYAETILASKDSPDEWAVSLKNYALEHVRKTGSTGDSPVPVGDPPTGIAGALAGKAALVSAGSVAAIPPGGSPGGTGESLVLPKPESPQARTFLEQKVREMILHEPWQRNPSTGFLEAFDVAVYLGGTGLMPPLTDLVRQKDNQAVAHAAYLALDRLTLQNPTAALGQLLDQPESMQGREATRANFFARADVSDAEQKHLLESYLLSPRVTATELNTFAGVYPNGNYMISQNLLTRTVTPDRDTLVKHDDAALNVVEGWLTDPRFEKLKPVLNEVRQRLGAFTQAAQSGR